MTVLSNVEKQKKCTVCTMGFFTRNTTQKYCSPACAYSARAIQTKAKSRAAEKRNNLKFKKEYGDKIGKLTLRCKNCKQPYDIYQSQVKWRGSTYCSIQCKGAGQTKAKTKSQLTKELDLYYSRYIRSKYAKEGVVSCVTCGKSDEIKNMQNGHYVSRVFRATRWLDKNCHPQCYHCNVGLGGNYANYTIFMINTYGNGVIEELVELSKVSPDFTKEKLHEKINFYKSML